VTTAKSLVRRDIVQIEQNQLKRKIKEKKNFYAAAAPITLNIFLQNVRLRAN
jgi:hypothetical protein